MAKNRRTETAADAIEEKKEEQEEGLTNGDTEKKKRKKEKKKMKNTTTTQEEIPTVSIAVAGSIIDNTQSYELTNRLAGQIARAAIIFRVDECLLPPLDAPHHLRKHEWGPYREGVTLKENPPNSTGTLVDVGLSKNVVIDESLEPGTRVTVAMGTDCLLETCNKMATFILHPSEMGGYAHVIGTSEHGLVIRSSVLTLPTFRHLLIAFGGLAGLEESIE